MADEKTVPAVPEDATTEVAERPRRRDAGTHTLGTPFNLSGQPSILNDPAFRARKKAKDARTAAHKRERGSGTGLGATRKEKV